MSVTRIVRPAHLLERKGKDSGEPVENVLSLRCGRRRCGGRRWKHDGGKTARERGRKLERRKRRRRGGSGGRRRFGRCVGRRDRGGGGGRGRCITGRCRRSHSRLRDGHSSTTASRRCGRSCRNGIVAAGGRERT